MPTVRKISIAALLLVASIALAGPGDQAKKSPGPSTEPTLIGVNRICDDAPHSAFTSLVRFQDQWVYAFSAKRRAHKGTRDGRKGV